MKIAKFEDFVSPGLVFTLQYTVSSSNIFSRKRSVMPLADITDALVKYDAPP